MEDSSTTDFFKDHFEKWRDYFSSHLLTSLFIGVGLVLIVLGAFFWLKSSEEEDRVEIIPAAQEKTSDKIMVDIEGAVEKPGVYELSFGSRLNDLLILAGGFSAKADRSWTELNLNKAQKLKDGDKVYIPIEGDRVKGESSSAKATEDKDGVMVSSKININSANLNELDTLWGVGLVVGQKIIDNRPYQKIEDLVNKKILSQATFQKIAGQISVY